MKRVKLVFVLLALLGLMAACTGTIDLRPQPMTPQRTYMEAQSAFLTAWTSYHKVWLALPETDPRKAQWVKIYHPAFLKAGELLATWGGRPEGYDSSADAAIAFAEDILIKLAIKQGDK